MTPPTLAQVTAHLTSIADAETAKSSKCFFKTGPGDYIEKFPAERQAYLRGTLV